jgi:NTE family protein
LKPMLVLVRQFQHCLEVLRFEEKKQQPESYYAEA